MFIIICNNSNIGYFSFSLFDGYLNFDSLYLLKKYQNNGFGKKVFEYAKKHAIDNGLREIRNSCNYNNKSAIQFYENMGGKIIKEDIESDKMWEQQVYLIYKL